MPKRARYHFGRLNVLPIRPYNEKLKWLENSLEWGGTVQDHNIHWQLFNIARLENDLGLFFSGFLGRYKEDTQIEIALPSGREIDVRTIENLISAKTLFFLHAESGVVAFRSVPKLIPPETFKARFTDLIFQGSGKFFTDVEIDNIEEPFSLREELKRFGRVNEVHIALHPSNPSNREVWKRVDRRLKDLKATKYVEQYETKDPYSSGLLILNDDDILSKIAMAEDGYGRVVVRGEIEGEDHTVTTTDNPVTALAPGEGETTKNVLKSLRGAFSRILARFQK